MPNSIIKEIIIDNNIISDNHEMANNFNEYFTNIGPTLANKIPHVNGDHLQFIKTFSEDSMFIIPTDEFEIKRIARNLLSIKSSGHDDISPKVVKSTIYLIYCVTFLTNHFFKVGSPRVVFIYKSDNCTLLTNYHPISVLPVFSKILEKSCLIQLLNLSLKIKY